MKCLEIKFCLLPRLFVVLVLDIFQCESKYGLKDISESFDVGTDDFKTLVLNEIFVDKSLLINDTLKCEEKVLQITRPRKWGKTVNLNMLKRFFEIELDKRGNPLPEEKKVNSVLFKGGKLKDNRKTKTLKPLKISGWDDVMNHMGKHPVIYVSLKDVKGKNYNQFEEMFKNVVVDLFLSYPFLKNLLDDDSDVLDVEEKIKLAKFVTRKFEDEDFVCCFEFLSKILYKHFKSEVLLFIDDYDVPIMNAFLEFGDKNREFDSIVVMLRVLFENAFKENQYLLKGILSGTLNFFVVSSGISEYHYVGFNTVLDKEFSSFYGFTQKDIGELMGKADILFNPVSLQKWYGGIHVHGEEIFNPWSVMHCLSKKGKFDYYLQKSHSTDLTRMMDKAFLIEEMQDYFHMLIEGKEVIRSSLAESVYLRSVTGDLYSVFVHAGYLNKVESVRPTDKPIWRMRIPNMDIRAVFAAGVGKWVVHELQLDDAEYENLVNLLLSKQVDKFGEGLEELLTLNKCGEQTKEIYYHNLVAGIVSSLGMKYMVESIKECGQNKGGNCLVPFEKYGSVAIKIEYRICNNLEKIEDLVDSAFDDLLNKPRTFSPFMKDHVHIKKTLNLAIGFCGARILVKHTIV